MIDSFFLCRFNSNCAGAARLAEMALELSSSSGVAEFITVLDEPVSRSRIERGGYLLSREVESEDEANSKFQTLLIK